MKKFKTTLISHQSAQVKIWEACLEFNGVQLKGMGGAAKQRSMLLQSKSCVTTTTSSSSRNSNHNINNIHNSNSNTSGRATDQSHAAETIIEAAERVYDHSRAATATPPTTRRTTA